MLPELKVYDPGLCPLPMQNPSYATMDYWLEQLPIIYFTLI